MDKLGRSQTEQWKERGEAETQVLKGRTIETGAEGKDGDKQVIH